MELAVAGGDFCAGAREAVRLGGELRGHFLGASELLQSHTGADVGAGYHSGSEHCAVPSCAEPRAWQTLSKWEKSLPWEGGTS